MKLVWSPETAAKAYLTTVKACEFCEDSSTAELLSSMAAGWNAKLMVETWSHGRDMTTSIGLAIARQITDGRHVLVVPDEEARVEYTEFMKESGMSPPDVLVGEPEEVMEKLIGIDFLVVDSRRKDFSRVLRLANLSSQGAVVVCKNENASHLQWRAVVEDWSRRLVRSVFLPVGKGLDIVHVSSSATAGDIKAVGNSARRWVKYKDSITGEQFVIRKP